MALEVRRVELVAARNRPGKAHRVARVARRDVVVDQGKGQARERVSCRWITLPISLTTAGSPLTFTWPWSYASTQSPMLAFGSPARVLKKIRGTLTSTRASPAGSRAISFSGSFTRQTASSPRAGSSSLTTMLSWRRAGTSRQTWSIAWPISTLVSPEDIASDSISPAPRPRLGRPARGRSRTSVRPSRRRSAPTAGRPPRRSARTRPRAPPSPSSARSWGGPCGPRSASRRARGPAGSACRSPPLPPARPPPRTTRHRRACPSAGSSRRSAAGAPRRSRGSRHRSAARARHRPPSPGRPSAADPEHDGPARRRSLMRDAHGQPVRAALQLRHAHPHAEPGLFPPRERPSVHHHVRALQSDRLDADARLERPPRAAFARHAPDPDRCRPDHGWPGDGGLVVDVLTERLEVGAPGVTEVTEP